MQDNYFGYNGEGARRAEFEIAYAEERWDFYVERAREYASAVQRQGNASSAATWRTAVAEGLNKSNKPAEAIREVRRALFEVHPESWAHRSAQVQLAKARLLERDYAIALGEGRNVMALARRLSDVLLLRDAAAVVRETGEALSDLGIVSEAEAELEAIRRLRNLPNGWDPALDVLPGEPGWDEHLSKLLIEAAGASKEAPQRLDAALVQAAELGLATAIKILAKQGASLTARDEKGNTVLEIAAKKGHSAAVAALLASGLLPSSDGSGWVPAIVGAIGAGHDEIAAQLIDGLESPGDERLRNWLLRTTSISGLRTASAILRKVSSINATNNAGLHPFVNAAREGNLPLVKLLFDHVPHVDVTEPDGETALIAAAKVGSVPVVEFLLEKGAKIDTIDDEDRTPVLAAIEGGHTMTAFELIQRQSPGELHSDRVRRAVVDAAARGRLDLVRLLESIGAPLSGQDGRGWTPIVAAARAAAESVLRFLLEAKVDANESDSDGETPFLAAAAYGHLGTLELLRSVATIDVHDRRGRTAISLAVENGHLAAVRLLKSFELAADLKDPSIQSALRTAAEKGDNEVLLEVLQDASPEDMSAIFPDRLDNVLVGGGVDANAIRSLVDDFAAEKDRENRLPSRNPTTLSEPAAQAQICTVGLATNASFGRLPLMQASHELTTVFRDWQKKATFSNVGEFDVESLRWAALPFLPGWRLALLSHKNGVAVPFVVKQQDVRLARAKNDWLYDLKDETTAEQSPEILKAYCLFFFAVVVGARGAFRFVDRVEQLPWKPSAGQSDRDRVKRHLEVLRYVGKASDGRHELRGTVLFKNALFSTSVMIGEDWIQELTNEELLEEDLPVYEGRSWDLLVNE
ncbi:ankyrin repeat domain-containing protein [Terriglobus roseus]|uniref:ankyrin repeat domain-containing protein n=1 Tax=Terriglobus roseus TaxID=392734 RepID=UPI0009F44EE2|nr:ankyrin repeat domain-containing protein [Terriglobus roseus]